MSNHGGGRKIATEWSEVVNLESDTRVMCKYCKEMISRKIERVRNHMKRCKARERQNEVHNTENSCVADQRRSATENDSAMILMTKDSDDITDHVVSLNSDQKKRRIQGSMSNFVVKTSKDDQTIIDKKIAAFFYSANIPFSVVESPQFVDMVTSLRPGYSLPNRKQLGGTLLNEASEKIEKKMKDEMDGATITLIQDGWSSVRNDPIIGSSLHTGKDTYLLNIIDAGSKKKNAEYCAEIALKSIEECKSKFGKDVFAVCTDNEFKMEKMREIVKEHHPRVLTFGCSAHFLNLVAKAISPISILNQVIEVQKYFRNVHQPHGWLKDYDCLMPQIPNSTRWNSHKDCISSFLQNYHKYVSIASQHQNEFDMRISKILDNVAIYKECLSLNKQLIIISSALDELQKDITTLSRSVEIWKNLIESEELKQHKEVILKRYKQVIGPEHFLANIIDVKYRGERLNPEEEEEAEDWIMQYRAEWLPAVLSFKIKDIDYFSKSFFSENIV